MSTYKGWDKEAVLQQGPPVADFTPINGPTAVPSGSIPISSRPTAQVSKALHGTGSKTSKSKAGKRASPSKVTRPQKRKKSNILHEEVTRTEVPCSNELTADHSHPLQTIADESDYGEDVDLAASHLLVPIYSQATSMDLVHQHGPTTSMHILKANAPRAQSDEESLADPYCGRSGVHPINNCRTQQLPSPPNSIAIEQPLISPALTQRENCEQRDKPTESSFLAVAQGTHDDDETFIGRDVRIGEVIKDKPARSWKMNVREVDESEDYGGALLSDDDRAFLQQVSAKRQQESGPVPIVRLPFAKPILDRSPIFGASAATLLRTCFRVGEALSVGAQAARTSKDVKVELYARVTSSQRGTVAANHLRQESIQNFLFKDLYHDNPPHLYGTCALWRQSPLWDLDSRPFLRAGEGSSSIMCRMVGKMLKVCGSWRMEVFSIWQASWEDVEAVAGIYARTT